MSKSTEQLQEDLKKETILVDALKTELQDIKSKSKSQALLRDINANAQKIQALQKERNVEVAMEGPPSAPPPPPGPHSDISVSPNVQARTPPPSLEEALKSKHEKMAKAKEDKKTAGPVRTPVSTSATPISSQKKDEDDDWDITPEDPEAARQAREALQERIQKQKSVQTDEKQEKLKAKAQEAEQRSRERETNELKTKIATLKQTKDELVLEIRRLNARENDQIVAALSAQKKAQEELIKKLSPESEPESMPEISPTASRGESPLMAAIRAAGGRTPKTGATGIEPQKKTAVSEKPPSDPLTAKMANIRKAVAEDEEVAEEVEEALSTKPSTTEEAKGKTHKAILQNITSELEASADDIDSQLKSINASITQLKEAANNITTEFKNVAPTIEAAATAEPVVEGGIPEAPPLEETEIPAAPPLYPSEPTKSAEEHAKIEATRKASETATRKEEARQAEITKAQAAGAERERASQVAEREKATQDATRKQEEVARIKAAEATPKASVAHEKAETPTVISPPVQPVTPATPVPRKSTVTLAEPPHPSPVTPLESALAEGAKPESVSKPKAEPQPENSLATEKEALRTIIKTLLDANGNYLKNKQLPKTEKTRSGIFTAHKDSIIIHARKRQIDLQKMIDTDLKDDNVKEIHAKLLQRIVDDIKLDRKDHGIFSKKGRIYHDVLKPAKEALEKIKITPALAPNASKPNP